MPRQPPRRSRYSSSQTPTVPRLPTLPTLQTASLAMATRQRASLAMATHHRASLQQVPTLPLALVMHPTLTLGVLPLRQAVYPTLLTLGVLLHLARGVATLLSSRAGTLLLLQRRPLAVLLLLPTHRQGTLFRWGGKLLEFWHS